MKKSVLFYKITYTNRKKCDEKSGVNLEKQFEWSNDLSYFILTRRP